MFCKKVGGHRLCNCVNSQILQSYPWAGVKDGRVCKIILMDLNHTHVVAIFELAKCFVEKVG